MTAAKANEKQTMRITLSKRTSFQMGREIYPAASASGRGGSEELSKLAKGLLSLGDPMPGASKSD